MGQDQRWRQKPLFWVRPGSFSMKPYMPQGASIFQAAEPYAGTYNPCHWLHLPAFTVGKTAPLVHRGPAGQVIQPQLDNPAQPTWLRLVVPTPLNCHRQSGGVLRVINKVAPHR